MMLTPLAFILFSAILIVLLCLGDPKRRRAAGLSGNGHSPAGRRCLAATSLLPGVYCAAVGHAAAFLIWLGGCAVAGWLVTLIFRARQSDRA